MLKALTVMLLASIFSFSAFSKELPSQFSNNLIYLTPKLTDGTTVNFFTDTGGGWNAISSQLQEKYGWTLYDKEVDNGVIKVTDMPLFQSSATIPNAGLNNWWAGKLQVVSKDKFSGEGNVDGFLGGRWHAEKIIDFNYLAHSISELSSTPDDIADFSTIPLGFQKNNDGNYTMAFPSMEISVEGQQIPMLLDTGASAWPTEDAKSAIGMHGNQIATSFIVANIFDNWKATHPEWLVVENACTYSKEPMIRVPSVEIGGQVVGPVWFTRRENKNFHQFMSSMMDKQIDGALGGSALKYVRIIVDYHKEVAYLNTKTGDN